jgi:hypothetical protein
LIHISAQDGREVGVRDTGVGARHEFDKAADLVAGGNLREADLARDHGEALFVRGKSPAVQAGDGRRTEAVIVGALQRLARTSLIERRQHLAFGGHPLARFYHAPVQQVGLHDVTRENIRTRLHAYFQRVGEALGDHQHNVSALALKERVGRDGGAELHRVNLAAAMHGQDLSDGLKRRVGVALGVFR